MTHTAFGTLLSIEPAFGTIIGLLVLAQTPSAVQLLGVAIVIAAGAGRSARWRARCPRHHRPARCDDKGDHVNTRPEDAVTPKYTSTFIFEIGDLDDDFHRINDEIAERARAIPGFLGEEAWHNEETGLHSEVYYWTDLDCLHQLVGMDTHRIAKGRYDEWLGEYRVVISEVRSVYGNPLLGLEHRPGRAQK